ncbi:MAG: RNA 2',3'-cyclic phosphodiesterase [Gammaproteobacteria bacterium]|nr:RNA 2',3'-cyclic phosphodiesterase [Gammaproteobacteria bacterium]
MKNFETQQQSTLRVFYALWPGDDVRHKLAVLAREVGKQSGGRMVNPEKLHLTLAFIGTVRSVELDCLVKLAAELPQQSFLLTFDRLGYWPNNGIVWLGCRQSSQQLEQLVEGLNQALGRRGYRGAGRKFSPHITLARRANRRPRLKAEPIEWPITGFSLIKSDLSPNGSAYSMVAQWLAEQ